MKDDLKLIYSVQKEVIALSQAMALLDWDQKTYMPPKGVEAKSEQIKYLHTRAHSLMTSNKLNQALQRLKRGKLKGMDALVVKDLDKDVKKLRKIPPEFVEKISKQEITAYGKWEEARKKNDFSIFQPHLKKMIDLNKQRAKYIDSKKPAYDVLIDSFEEGMTSEKLTEFFKELKKGLVELLEKIKSTKQYKTQKKTHTQMPEEKQESLIIEMAKKMGADFNRLRLDKSAHPFTLSMGSDDVRITTRYPNFESSFLGGVHETGHALYELGLPSKFKWTVLRDAPSMGIHESQSLFWEKRVASSEAFWKKEYSKIKKYSKGGWQKFYKNLNLVKPSYIRVDADEVTYCLHIILRFEIERDLINGKIKPANAKNAWNKKFKEMFGLNVKNDNQGILQDVHWSLGAFGYFPSYAIGMSYASQLYKAMNKDVPGLEKKIETQKFEKVLEWLGKKVHDKGSTLLADEIVKKACGIGLTPKPLLEYLNEKYSKIYGFR